MHTRRLLLGGIAAVITIGGARAAEMPVKAKPVQYVKVCTLYGDGFYYIPATQTCMKIGGFVRAEIKYDASVRSNRRLTAPMRSSSAAAT